MNKRPDLDSNLDSKLFSEYYYLKEELVTFCRNNGLPTSGGKLELTDRIAKFLDTKEIENEKRVIKKKKGPYEITLDTKIEENIVCSEKHREFYKAQIGNSFSFNVDFQKWLKSNAGKSYRDSVDAYYEILENKKKRKSVIDAQFEYNAYIRDFFKDNKDKSLEQAIKCWKYKKSLKGHNKYEKDDLEVLKF